MSETSKDQLKLSPRERSLLEELAEIKELSRQLVQAMADQNATIAAQQKELGLLRRSMIDLREENSRLRSALQNWRERVDQVIAQLRSPL